LTRKEWGKEKRILVAVTCAGHRGSGGASVLKNLAGQKAAKSKVSFPWGSWTTVEKKDVGGGGWLLWERVSDGQDVKRRFNTLGGGKGRACGGEVGGKWKKGVLQSVGLRRSPTIYRLFWGVRVI